MPKQDNALTVRRLQLAIKAAPSPAAKRRLQHKLRELCADLARRDYRDKLANLGNMANY